MENKKIVENIRVIKSLMYEQETQEGILDDVKDYLLDKISGLVGDTKLGSAFDNLLSGDEENIKSVYNVPEKPASEMSKDETRQLYSSVKDDDDFYAKVLWGLNLPVTKHNIDFLKLWRIAEMGTEKNTQVKKTATNNPLNTTQELGYDYNMSNYNNVGVKNYSKPEYGIEATIKTLKNGFYNCVLDGLRRELPYEEIADCKTGKSLKSAMDTWGTTSKHMKNVIKTHKNTILDPRKIDMSSNNMS
jgi:hypothetical protein